MVIRINEPSPTEETLTGHTSWWSAQELSSHGSQILTPCSAHRFSAGPLTENPGPGQSAVTGPKQPENFVRFVGKVKHFSDMSMIYLNSPPQNHVTTFYACHYF